MIDDELMHYGVIGMKLGVYRGNVAKAYNKVTVKRNKLDNRVSKAKKAYERATIKSNTGVSNKYKKLQSKAGSTKSRYLKAQRKAEKWAKAMDKTFKNHDVSKLSSSKINAGKYFINKNI